VQELVQELEQQHNKRPRTLQNCDMQCHQLLPFCHWGNEAYHLSWQSTCANRYPAQVQESVQELGRELVQELVPASEHRCSKHPHNHRNCNTQCHPLLPFCHWGNAACQPW